MNTLYMDINQRATEILQIFTKLRNLNTGIMGFEEFSEFRKICNVFIKTGNPVKGSIEVYGTKRIICYNFGSTIDCFLKYDESI